MTRNRKKVEKDYPELLVICLLNQGFGGLTSYETTPHYRIRSTVVTVLPQKYQNHTPQSQTVRNNQGITINGHKSMVTGQWSRIKGQCTVRLCVTHGDGLFRMHGNLIGIDDLTVKENHYCCLYSFFLSPSDLGNNGKLED